MSYHLLVKLHDEHEGAFTWYWHVSSDLGVCIADVEFEVLNHLAPDGSFVYAVDLLECDRPPDDYQGTPNTSLFWSGVLNTWAVAPLERSFIPPTGVVPALETVGLDIDELHEGYCLSESDPPLSMFISCDRENLHFLIWSIADILPPARRLDIQFLGYSTEDLVDETWTVDPKRLSCTPAAFLLAHDRDLLANGFLSLELSCGEPCYTVRLSEHKTLFLELPDPGYADKIERSLRKAGIPRVSRILTLESDFVHYHYALPHRRHLPLLREELVQEGFERVFEADVG